MEDYEEENDTDKEVKEELTADMVEKNNKDKRNKRNEDLIRRQRLASLNINILCPFVKFIDVFASLFSIICCTNYLKFFSPCYLDTKSYNPYV